MAQINLAETIQKNLGFPPLQKIDPNTQEVKDEAGQNGSDRLAQAAIPSVLTGLYLYATSEEGGAKILGGNNSTNWVDTIYKNNGSEIISKVATYAGTNESVAAETMERIADEAVAVIQQNIPKDAAPNQVNEFFTSQRDNILVYLPATLQVGQLLKDDTLDDRTNKMEGPVSSLMHKVENAFSSGTKEKE